MTDKTMSASVTGRSAQTGSPTRAKRATSLFSAYRLPGILSSRLIGRPAEAPAVHQWMCAKCGHIGTADDPVLAPTDSVEWGPLVAVCASSKRCVDRAYQRYLSAPERVELAHDAAAAAPRRTATDLYQAILIGGLLMIWSIVVILLVVMAGGRL